MSRTLLERDAALKAIVTALPTGPVVVLAPAGRGKTAVLAAISERHDPIVIADDVHRADAETLRRLTMGGPGVLAAARPLPAGEQPDFERLLAAATIVELEPLSAEAIGTLLGVGRAEAERARARTGGNPFLAEHLAAGAPPRRLVAHVASGGRGVVRLGQALAVLGPFATLARAARVAALDAATADAVATALVNLDAWHALVLDALLENLADHERRRLRAAAGRVLDADGVGAELVADLLLDAEPAGDRRVVTVLERAAARARATGNPVAAVQALSRALIEPPEAAVRLRIRLALAEARTAAGDPAAEADHEAALDLATSDVERIEVLIALGRARVERGNFPAATEAVARAEALLEATSDDELVRRVKAVGVLARSFTGPDEGALDLTDPAQRAQSLLTAALTLTIDATRAGEQAAELAANERLAAAADPGTISMITGVLYFVGALEASIAFSTAAIGGSGRSPQELAVLRYLRAAPLLLVGRLDEAEADARACVEVLGSESAWGLGGSYILAHVLMERDAVPDAVRIMEQKPSGGLDPGAAAQVWHANRARVLLAAGDAAGALGAALESRRHVVGFEPRGTSYNDWRRPAAFAQLVLGDRTEAATSAREALTIAKRWGAPEDLVEPLIVVGLAENDTASLDGAVDAARQAEDVRLQIEALRHRGAALRRGHQGRRAREDLYAARDLAAEHGFARLERLAGEELEAAGARPRTGPRTGAAALTASEERVVRLAAGGRTNRDIAAELFLSSKTVEFHLANAYRKLGVRSRGELRTKIGK